MSDSSFLVIGGGVAGAATAWSLTQLGAEGVTLLERERTLGTQSSGLNAAILRTLSSSRALSEFSRRGADFLHSPPKDFSPVPLVHTTGLVLTADASASRELKESFQATGPDSGGVPIDRERLRELFPALELEFEFALWFPREGRIDIAALMAGFERGARRGGAKIETHCSVTDLLVENGGVCGVRLGNGERRLAEKTVLAAGAWAGALGRRAGSPLELEPRRRHLMVTTRTPELDPSLPVIWHHGREPFYARPESSGVLFCACDEKVVDPDRCSVDPKVHELLADRASAHLPSLAHAGISSLWAGMRTFGRDNQFVIGPDPILRDLYWVAGLGGHGMVCGAPAGDLAARELLGMDSGALFREDFSPSRAAGMSAFSAAVSSTLHECSSEDRNRL